jgi:hypothetical protein
MARTTEEQQALFEESLEEQRRRQAGEPNAIGPASPNVQKQQQETQTKVFAEFMKAKPSVQTRMISQSAPEQVATILDQAPAPDNIKNQAKRIHADPQALARKHNEIENKRVEGKPLGLLDTFLEASAFFLPQALGAAVGGILEGTEGAVAGAEEGGRLGTSFRQAKLQQEQLELRKAKTEADISQGERALGIRAEQAQATEQRLAQAEERLQIQRQEESRKEREARLRQERFEQQQALNIDKFGLTTKKSEELSDKQVDDLSNIQVALDQVNDFNFKALTTTGPVEGRIRSVAESMGIESNLDFVELKAQVNATLADYMKAISGAAISEKEAERLSAILPQAKDSAPAFKAKLARFERQLRSRLKTKVTGITKGQVLRSASAKRFLEGKETSADVRKEKAPAVKRTAVRRLSADKLQRLKELRAKRGNQ